MLSHSVSFGGEGLEPSAPVLKASVPASVSGMDYLERLDVARRDGTTLENRPLPALRSEGPIHLLGATNQIQTPAAVRQQIPTKLATFTKGSKEKGGKHKASGNTEEKNNSCQLHCAVTLAGILLLLSSGFFNSRSKFKLLIRL